MALVETAKGFIDRTELRIVDVVTENDDCRKIETQFLLGNELVRQDVTVSMFRGLPVGSAQGAING